MDTTHNYSPEIFTVKGDWNEQSKKLKNQFNNLTDADLKYKEGREGDLISRVANRLNKNNVEVVGILAKNQLENTYQ